MGDRVLNKFEQRSKDSYNKKAEKYDSTFDGKFTVKFKNMIFNNLNISNNSNVLDIACGNGRLLQMLSSKCSFNGYGVDISEKMIAQAKSLNPSMNFYVAGCEKLPFEDNFIDLITVSASFHHFPDVEKFAKEVNRIVKKGGKIYIAEIYLPHILQVIFNPFVKFSKAGDVKFYSPKEIASLFEKNDFYTDNIVIDGMIQLISLCKK